MYKKEEKEKKKKKKLQHIMDGIYNLYYATKSKYRKIALQNSFYHFRF